jgi:hypothetical protein
MMSTPKPMPDHNAWPEYVINGLDNSVGPTDLSYLLEKPAGAKGFISIRDGHLSDGAGNRWRAWGVNFTGRMALPPLEMAPKIARHLAKFGVNCVRIHFVDIRWPNGILVRGKEITTREIGARPQRNHEESTRALDAEGLERLDYLVACCKENGIYVDLNLNVARPFTEADGVTQPDWLGYAKAATYFDPRLVELQKEYAAQLLGHVNPFTGNRYADEPAVALVELLNENSILESWLCDRLQGKNMQNTGTWSDIPPYYGEALDRLWNAWLARRYASHQELREAWHSDLGEQEQLDQGNIRRLRKPDFASAAYNRLADETEFYRQIEQNYFADMLHFLREEIGVRQIVLGSSDHNSGLNNPFHLQNLSELGITDGHFYWEHPEFPGNDWSRGDWFIRNTAMTDSLDRNVIARLARSKVRDMPYIVSETNAPFPNDFAAGFLTILAAYGSFQDWDGLFPYNYNEVDGEDHLPEGRIIHYFATGADPVKMTEAAAAGLAFLRGDVMPAAQTVDRSVTRQQMVSSQIVPLTDAPFWLPDLPGRLALAHGVRIANFNAEANLPASIDTGVAQTDIFSDTRQLRWRSTNEDGRVWIDTPRWQGILGKQGRAETTHILLELTSPYASVQVISLDGQPIEQTGRMLLVSGARVANSGMAWTDESRTSLGVNFGGAPTRIEPVQGTLFLRGLHPAKRLLICPLDGNGQPIGQPQYLAADREGWRITMGDQQVSPWYLIEVEQ